MTVLRGRTFTYDAYYLRVSPTRDRIGVRVESVNLVETIMLGPVNPLGDYFWSFVGSMQAYRVLLASGGCDYLSKD